MLTGPGDPRSLVTVGGHGHKLLVRLPGEEVLAVLAAGGPVPVLLGVTRGIS